MGKSRRSRGSPAGTSTQPNQSPEVTNGKVNDAMDGIYDNGIYDDFVQAFRESYGGYDGFLNQMKDELEKYIKDIVGEDIPVYLGDKSTQAIINDLSEGQTAVNIYPDGPDYVNFDVLTAEKEK